MSRRVLAVSPHLDDAAFSAGAALAAHVEAGDAVTLVTVFTRSVPEPTGFALACQLDKGLGPDVDYMALRREEDLRAAAALGIADVRHLPFAEAPHRGYGSAAELFAGVRDDDPPPPLAAELPDADLVYLPQGIGSHVDHLQVIAACAHVDPAIVRRWRDLPYGLRPEAPAAATDEATVAPTPAKLDACAAYASQLGFQFGDEATMRQALGDVPERLAMPGA